MNMLKMLLAEIGYRKLNFVLSLSAITVAVALFVTGPLLVDSYGQATRTELDKLERRVAESAERLAQSEAEAARELALLEDATRRVMRDMGFNLKIVHGDADTIDFLSTGIANVDMPQQYIERLAEDPRLTMVTHLVATLRDKITFDGREVYLVGYLPETPQPHRTAIGIKKKAMGYDIAPGTAQLGHALAKGRKKGETIEVLGKQLQIAQILAEKGNNEDITIAVHLDDAQALLERPGKINQILALECRCAVAALPAIRRQLRDILPDTHVIRDTSKADARALQRQLVAQKHQRIVTQQKSALAEREQALADTAARRENILELMQTLAGVLTPVVVLASAIWVGLLALANVRQRRTEIGILRALGKGSATIASLFLGKAVLMGLLGGLVGCLLGVGLARWLGVEALELSPNHFRVPSNVLLACLLGAPLMSALASYLPTLSALTQDPAVVLREQ